MYKKSTGTLTAADLIGPFHNDLALLMTTIRDGNAYVDIPTNDGVPPAGSSPGDYPNGELRGQIR